MQCINAYAEQLAKKPTTLLSPVLEAEYRATHLARVRTRARAWFTFSAVVCAILTVTNCLDSGTTSFISLVHLFLLLPCCLTILYVCWSTLYQRAYLRIVPYVYSVVIIFIGASVADQVSRGELDAIGQLVCNTFALYFFASFSWRQSLVLSVISTISFTICCLLAGVDVDIVLRCEAHVVVATVAATVVYIDIERTNRKRYLQESLLQQMATRDGLSGLMNRRAFDEHLARLWCQGLRDERPVVLMLADVDHFKRFNDQYGHQAGDAEIRRVSSVIQEFGLRPLDLAARYGGEEFALLLYDVDVDHAYELAEQMRKRVKVAGLHRSEVPFATVSVGIAVGTPLLGRTPAGLLQLADEALYEAKRDGRDRCVVKGHADHEKLTTGAFVLERSVSRRVQ